MGIFNKKRDDYKVKIDEFYGPLDLLVHLIENAKMSIYDINISEITDQYIAYLKAMKEERYDVEVEFLVLASTLIELKSMMILSRKEENVTKEELYEDLEARLISYKRVKIIASMLSQKYMEGLFYLEKPAEDLSRFNKAREDFDIDQEELIDAFDAFVNKRIKLNQINTLYKRKRRRINIRDKMRNILHFVKKNPKKKAEIRSFMKDKNNKYELAVTFSSVLELEKAKKIAADQDENFAPIYVYGKEERG